MGRTESLNLKNDYERACGWYGHFNKSEMALFSECTDRYVQKLLDTADIVREAMLRQSSVTKITDSGARLWESYEAEKVRHSVSTIEEVRAAEKKVQKILDALKKVDAGDAEDLSAELTKATDEYAKAVRELRSG